MVPQGVAEGDDCQSTIIDAFELTEAPFLLLEGEAAALAARMITQPTNRRQSSWVKAESDGQLVSELSR